MNSSPSLWDALSSRRALWDKPSALVASLVLLACMNISLAVCGYVARIVIYIPA